MIGLIAAGVVALAVLALVAWLAHAAIAATERASAERVARADAAAQLAIAQANVATHAAAIANLQRVAAAYQETTRASSAAPLPAGVDGLLLAIDAYRALVPTEPPAGGDRPADVGGGLPGGAGPAGGPGDAGEAGGPATVPDPGGIAHVLR